MIGYTDTLQKGVTVADPDEAAGSHVLGLLRLHEQRRERNLPTVSVMVGPADCVVSEWQRWSAEAGYCPFLHARNVASGPVPALVGQIHAHCDLPRLALNALLQRAGRPTTASASPLSAPLDGRTLLE